MSGRADTTEACGAGVRHGGPELLAPAQDFACLHAAIHAGCNAVYLGLEGLNMRTAARNFRGEELPAASAVCRDEKVRLYLTLNSIVYDGEMGEVRSLLEGALGLVDAVICWDPAVIRLCREMGHGIHISTMASVANSATARFYQSLGAVRVVPARECTLAEVKTIRQETGIEVETFVHGAMCVNYSGRCFLGQDVFQQSGNRGRCVQPCRREYLITEVEDGDQYILGQDYVLSARDVCTLPFLEELLEAGIDAFKIEGRNRNPEYVDTTVRCYRRAIEAYREGALDEALKAELTTELASVFNRRFSDGFYHGRPIEAFTQSRRNQATHRKEYVGIVTNYYARAGAVEVDVKSHGFRAGDELMIQGPTTGVVSFRPQEMRVGNATVSEAGRGIVTARLGQKVRRGDRVYIRVLRRGRRAGED
ncbi:MAG: U32 family peptidase [Lentisphaeria bacterium]|nr:U32 family peptidase [Lentisphaeria bacterium]